MSDLSSPMGSGRRRRPANLTLDAALLDEAKALGVNVSQACERGLRQQVHESRAEAWLRANADALESSGCFVEQKGLPLASRRLF